MCRDTNSSNIYTISSKCTTSFGTIVRETSNLRNDLKRSFPLEADISACRQEFQQWAMSFGANLSPSSMISLDYKFRNQDYTRSEVLTKLGHLLDDLERLQREYEEQKAGGDAKVIFNKVESDVAELKRFLGHLPKELWLEPEK
ncbi:hypothetical protein NW762_007268 [Fusarium torreyae]|uniref:Uncharacterized protein n=1 Tax=Fusarium torreyae TaxID=1237075 RepID=A0A9W8VD68_9HYPO|nr:hypothetical protein NW762_007268 [Fusarium torreyae]